MANSTGWINFPDGINNDTYYVNGYFQGEEHCTTRSMSAKLFDTISYIRNSPSQKKNLDVVHAIGYRSGKTNRGESQTLVITLRRRKNERG